MDHAVGERRRVAAREPALAIDLGQSAEELRRAPPLELVLGRGVLGGEGAEPLVEVVGGDADLERIVRAAVASTGASGMGQMGQVMKAAQGEIAGRADGGRVAAIVRKVLVG
jgi:hypothetical protein